MSVFFLLQSADDLVVRATQPLLDLAQVFTLLFVVIGPPLKSPALFYARTQGLAPSARRWLALNTFALATVASLLGGFLGVALLRRRANPHTHVPSGRGGTPDIVCANGVQRFLA